MIKIREPDNIREKVHEDYKRGMTYKEIASKYGISQNTISSWRKRYKWSKDKVIPKKQKGKVGAPKGNKNNLKHGLYSKYMPKEIQSIMEEINNESQIDILWQGILIQYARVIQSQKIMHVKNKKDMTKELRKEKVIDGDKYSTEEKEYEIQFAWDKQANFLRAQSTAMATLNRMLKEYDEMLHKNWELATEEQKARVALMKAKVQEDIEKDEAFIEKGKKIDNIESILKQMKTPKDDD